MPYYFIRVAGNTAHNNPNESNSYVSNEPPTYPETYFNYFCYCLKNDIIRIGWPDVGDLTKGDKFGALANAYSLNSVKPHIKKYLLDFSHISLKSIVLMPNKDTPGHLYIGEVVHAYRYSPKIPYECAHQLGVNWDKDGAGKPHLYHAKDLNIRMIGGWWMRAFYEITDSKITDSIDTIRANKF